MKELEFEPGSLLPPPNIDLALAFEKWLCKWNTVSIEFDVSYLSHCSKFHGGTPKQACFLTSRGVQRRIVRFLNFLEGDQPLIEYGVEQTWSLLEGPRISRYLVPFAELFAGDMLCFDFEQSGRPRVVVWLHELSTDKRGPKTENVAENFDAFLDLLSECGRSK